MIKNWQIRLGGLIGAAVLFFLLAANPSGALAQSASFTITAQVQDSSQGSISPFGDVVIGGGGSQTFVVTPNPGYKIGFVEVDGRTQGTMASFTFTNVSANHTIKAGFSRMTYTIIASSGPNGTMFPTSRVLVENGNSQTFTIAPNPGYQIATVAVDDSQMGPVTSYTFSNVDRDHTISVTFAALNPVAETTTPPQPKPGVTELAGAISAQGVFSRDVTALSSDNTVRLNISRGTSVLLSAGQGMFQIEIARRPVASQPDGLLVVGDAYDITPDAAAFDQPVRLSIGYDPRRVPAGVAENRLAIAAYSRATGTWAAVGGGMVDASGHAVQVPIRQLGRYAVVAPTHPATFTTTDLEIAPKELRPGSSAAVNVTVTNNGDLPGSYTVTLRVDGSVISTKDLNLAGGAQQRVGFSVPASAVGTHVIDVEGLSGTFLVSNNQQPAPPVVEIRWSVVLGIMAGTLATASMIAMLVVLRTRGRESKDKG